MRLPFLNGLRGTLGRRARCTEEAPVPLLLYTRAGCLLCEELERTLAGLQLSQPTQLEHVDIAADPALEAALGRSIPVLTAGGRTAAKGRTDAAALARRLERLFREYRREGPVAPRFEEHS